jgi:hypothetical protein
LEKLGAELNIEMETSNSRLQEIEDLNLENQTLQREIQRLKMDVGSIVSRITTGIKFGFSSPS